MLDLDHPLTKHIFAASGLADSLMVNAQRMTLLPSQERILLLEQCLLTLDQLRDLNKEHFESSLFISIAIEEAQTSLEQLASLNNGNIVEDRTDSRGNCAACDTPITTWETFPGKPYNRQIILCQHCIEGFMKAKAKLGSPEGFGTCFI